VHQGVAVMIVPLALVVHARAFVAAVRLAIFARISHQASDIAPPARVPWLGRP
jgi:hypothetical protein